MFNGDVTSIRFWWCSNDSNVFHGSQLYTVRSGLHQENGPGISMAISYWCMMLRENEHRNFHVFFRFSLDGIIMNYNSDIILLVSHVLSYYIYIISIYVCYSIPIITIVIIPIGMPCVIFPYPFT